MAKQHGLFVFYSFQMFSHLSSNVMPLNGLWNALCLEVSFSSSPIRFFMGNPAGADKTKGFPGPNHVCTNDVVHTRVL